MFKYFQNKMDELFSRKIFYCLKTFSVYDLSSPDSKTIANY